MKTLLDLRLRLLGSTRACVDNLYREMDVYESPGGEGPFYIVTYDTDIDGLFQLSVEETKELPAGVKGFLKDTKNFCLHETGRIGETEELERKKHREKIEAMMETVIKKAKKLANEDNKNPA